MCMKTWKYVQACGLVWRPPELNTISRRAPVSSSLMMYAVMAFDPNTSHGQSAAFPERVRPHPLCSTAHHKSASSTSDHPAAARTYELVHIFLFSGNHMDQKYPAAKHAAAPATSPSVLAETSLRPRSHSPASKPSSVVPMAGMSLSRPSGSRALCRGQSS